MELERAAEARRAVVASTSNVCFKMFQGWSWASAVLVRLHSRHECQECPLCQMEAALEGPTAAMAKLSARRLSDMAPKIATHY